MKTLSGYEITEEIYQSSNSVVFRGYQAENNRPVILKMLNQAYPSPEKIAWFKREYEIMRTLNLATSSAGQTLVGVVGAYDLETDQDRWVLVLEDFGGESLTRLGLAGNLSLSALLPLAIQIVDILGQLHQQNIIHKDLNPSNIVLNPSTGQVKLIDFGISTLLSRETLALRSPNMLEGTLAYISPEQTGRMNRAIDYRTDFYSLGVTFYELLTGQLPFPATDPMELIHAHIARQPLPPHSHRSAIPQALSNIVLKLMAKNAEDRYQSAYGLKTDLEECLRQWQTKGQIEAFSLGQHDISDRFQTPQRLYGREQEIETLLAAFARVVRTEIQAGEAKSEMMLVSGYPGIGKSALIQEVYKPITYRRGYFISGKFDQLQRNTPYAPLAQAFRALMRQLLAENEIQLSRWRERLLAAFGPNGQIIIEVIPEVELIVGPQPSIPDLTPLEAQNRFNLVFQNFIQVFTQPEHPLVLFLDDLQWADVASLRLLQLLMTAPESRHLFIIGAYRDNEVSAAHPLILTLEEIRKARGNINQIALTPLALSHVNQLVSDTLYCNPDIAEPLAKLVLTKTNGNPFFIIEFLKSLYADALLRFNFQQGSWQWDLNQIQSQDMTDNVVELMADKVRRLEEKTQQVLKLAACIGNRFDLRTLAIVYEKSPRETAIDLWEAMMEGLVLPLGDTYKLMQLEVQGLAEEVTVEYKFAHDRVQQAVYFLIPETDKQVVHRQVGQLLLANTSVDEQEQRLFDIVNQLNWGLELVRQPAERIELAKLNLRAGQKAKASAAYQPAFNYLQLGLELLEQDSWREQYKLSLDLHTEGAEAAFLSTDFEQMERLIKMVQQHAANILDQVKVYEIQIQAHIAQNDLLAAVQTALVILKLLDVNFPLEPNQADILASFQEIAAALNGRELEDLAMLPRMTDPAKLAVIRILKAVSAASFLAAPQLFALMILKQVSLSIQYGNANESALVYANYGIMLTAMEDIESGYRAARLALRLFEQFNVRELKANVWFSTYVFAISWKEPVRELLPRFLEGYQSGLETGNPEATAYLLSIYVLYSYCIGRELAQLEREMVLYNQIIGRLKQERTREFTELFHQSVLNLMGRSERPYRLIGENINEEELLPRYLAVNDLNGLCHVYLHKLIVCYLFQEYPQAADCAVQLEKNLIGFQGMFLTAVANFYISLAHLAVFSEVTQSEQAEILETVTINQEKMEQWSQHAPMNFLHHYYLVEAERARVLGKDSEARDYYDQAIILAQQNEYRNVEALAYELAGKFYLARGQHHVARHYLYDAHYAYQHWGAVAKVKDLESRYPQLRLRESPASTTISAKTSTSQTRPSGTLDLSSVLKASQAISGEILLETLLAQLMRIVMENAGAERGVLILEKQSQPHAHTRQSPNGGLASAAVAPAWVIEAEGSINQAEVMMLQSTPVEQGDLSIAVVNYVTRTRESVVLHDALHEGAFTQDDYMVARQPKSLLCMPLIHQGKLTGLLYLENNLTTGAFTSDRLEVLKVLASQAAVSLENARLYSNLATSEQRFRTLFENAPLAVVEVDLNPDTLVILAANHQAELVYGWTAKELITLPPRQLVPVEAIPQLSQMIARIRAGETVTLETSNQRRDGTSFPVRLSATPELAMGLNRMIVTVEDITLEKQRQAEAEAIEAERRRIAHEIHDGLAQDLAALRFKAALWHDLVDRNPGQMHAELNDLVEILNGSIREVRRSIFALRPLALDELGFFPALSQFTGNFGEQYQLQIRLRISGPETHLPNVLELPLFRIIQESLNNIRKHAQANTVQIHLDLEQVDRISLTIQDDGAGFDPTTLEELFQEGHVGLKQMRERVQTINGSLSIQSEVGRGTAIEVILPLGTT